MKINKALIGACKIFLLLCPFPYAIYYLKLWRLDYLQPALYGVFFYLASISMNRFRIRNLIYCVIVGAISAYLKGAFDSVMIIVVSFVSAMLSYDFKYNISALKKILCILVRVIVVFSICIVLLSLPFPRSGMDPFAGGDITGNHYTFVSITYIIIGSIILYSYVEKIFLEHYLKAT